MFIKSIYIIDLKSFIEAINKDVLLFSLEYDIKNSNDLTNLFISRMILKIADSYKEIKNSFIYFYIDINYKNNLIKNGDLIKYKKFFNLIEKKIGFPILKSESNFTNFTNELKENEALYDEILTKYTNFSSILPKLIEIIRKYRYKRVDNEIIKEVKNLIKLISSI